MKTKTKKWNDVVPGDGMVTFENRVLTIESVEPVLDDFGAQWVKVKFALGMTTTAYSDWTCVVVDAGGDA